MSYPRAIGRKSAIIRRMSRFAWVLLVGVSCSKPAASTDSASGGGGGSKIAVPGGEGAPEIAVAKTTNDSRFRLTPDEGNLAIEPPTDAKANTETTVRITVTAGTAYKVNTEFPSKLTLETTSGVTLAKAELKAGGHDKARGDADVLDEHQLVFAVKFTPAASGNYAINGSFKFAVCDKAGSTCLAKKEPIAIQVAAK